MFLIFIICIILMTQLGSSQKKDVESLFSNKKSRTKL